MIFVTFAAKDDYWIYNALGHYVLPVSPPCAGVCHCDTHFHPARFTMCRVFFYGALR
jgi:hypothetical protein